MGKCALHGQVLKEDEICIFVLMEQWFEMNHIENK